MLHDRVHVSRRFQRSIRIDTDLNDPAALEGFVCPQSSADVLSTMAHHIAESGQCAFTWTGPYGSGKSSLVVVLSALLSGDITRREAASEILGRGLSETLWNAIPPKEGGWRILPVVGRREDASKVIGEALEISGFAKTPGRAGWTSSRILNTLGTVAADLASTSGGLIVFIDELGRLLEGAAQGATDIHLFQDLAEMASRSGNRLIVVGILHQSFEEYANRLSHEFRDSWAKVQGRFVDLAVNTAGDEQLELLARAITSNGVSLEPSEASTIVASIIQSNRPGASKDLAYILQRCWPLHPAVAALLGPISRRRFGQNQRSLFGFLNSAEASSFQDFLRNSSDGAIYSLENLFDYLRGNLEAAILSSPDGHRWAMAIEAVERCEAIGGAAIHLDVLKAISLVDLFRERSGLIGSQKLLATCLPVYANTDIENATNQLKQWSFIVYRQHLGGFAIYAGSDFDIEAALVEALEATQEIDFGLLRNLAGLQPVMAKRHYHHTGALRWFDVDLISFEELGKALAVPHPRNGAIGRFILAVPVGGQGMQNKVRKQCRELIDSASVDAVIGVSSQEWQLTTHAREFLALTKLIDDRAELQGDAVARREVVARLAASKLRLEQSLERSFDTAEWFQARLPAARHTYAELNGLASDIADTMFPLSPFISNELLNRIRPSSNAIAAQKTLLKKMVLNEGSPRLGIEGFPAEGGLYESILASTKLYCEIDGAWKFVTPSPDHDPCRLNAIWEAADYILEKEKDRSVSLSEIYDVWRGVPYGVRDGLFAVLAVAFILSRRNKLAFYRSGIFQARFTDLDVDYLTMDPGSIQLRWMDLSDISRQILSGMADVVRQMDHHNTLVNLEPIDVARGLVSVHENLKPWARRTMRLSANAIRVRNALKAAQDPNKLLFNDLPALFSDDQTDLQSPLIDQVILRVREGLEELTGAYFSMLGRLRETLLSELHVPNKSNQSIAELRERAANILQLTGDNLLNAFTGRLAHFSGTEEDIEGLASLATNKPSRDWTDADLDAAAIELTDLSQRFVRAEAFARVKGRIDKRHSMAVIVGTNGRPTPYSREFSVVEGDRGAIDRLMEEVAAVIDAAEHSQSVVLAALAEIASKYIEMPENGFPLRKSQK